MPLELRKKKICAKKCKIKIAFEIWAAVWGILVRNKKDTLCIYLYAYYQKILIPFFFMELKQFVNTILKNL